MSFKVCKTKKEVSVVGVHLRWVLLYTRNTLKILDSPLQKSKNKGDRKCNERKVRADKEAPCFQGFHKRVFLVRVSF